MPHAGPCTAEKSAWTLRIQSQGAMADTVFAFLLAAHAKYEDDEETTLRSLYDAVKNWVKPKHFDESQVKLEKVLAEVNKNLLLGPRNIFGLFRRAKTTAAKIPLGIFSQNGFGRRKPGHSDYPRA